MLKLPGHATFTGHEKSWWCIMPANHRNRPIKLKPGKWVTFKVNLPVFARYIIPEIQCPESVTGQHFDIRLESNSGPSWSREDVKFSTVTRPFVPEEIGSNLNWVVNRIRVRLSGEQEEQVSMTLHVTTDDHPRFFEYLISQ